MLSSTNIIIENENISATTYQTNEEKLIKNNSIFNIVRSSTYNTYLKGQEEINKSIVRNEVIDLTNYFSDIKWIERKGVLSLSLLQKKDAFNEITIEKRDKVFAKLEETFSNDYRWNNQSKSIYDQYICHVSFASSKVDWNLEPQRPVVDSWNLISLSCNPPIDGTVPKTNSSTFIFEPSKLLFNKN